MGRVIFLGTGSALPSETQDNTSLLIESNGSYLMIDCSGTPYRKLLKLGVERDRLEHILITHHHIDHIYALPSLIECLWVEGRDLPLHIYALPSAMKAVETLLDLWNLRSRPVRQFQIELHSLAGYENELILQNINFTIRTSPMVHAVPSVATKITFPDGKTFVYSSDTAPCKQLVEFAKGVDYVLMECTFCGDDEGLAEVTLHLNSNQYRELAHSIAANNTLLIHHSDVTACPHVEVLQEIGPLGNGHKKMVYLPHDMEILEL
ncbi:ribonuclease Z [Candidatus Chlorohelix sp.]|uniref:MBL fold metallo-hydrolase n=1 Tax=Candidatus Chlorohelix sp. TaxID=3139201 RepID=UPI00305F5878